MSRKNTALMVIDVVNFCAHEKYEQSGIGIRYSKIRKMIPKLDNFISIYRTVINDSIVYVKTVPWRKEYLTNNINQLYERKEYSYYTKDTSGFAEKFYELKPSGKDLVIEKNTLDAYTNSRLTKFLEQKGTEYIITTGVFTDGCVLATVVGGFSKGYSVIILKDLVQTTDDPTRQRIQKDLLGYTFPFLFARVTTSSKLLNDWK